MSRPRRLASTAVWLLPLAVGVGLVIHTVVMSPRKFFWADEIFTWHLVAAPLSRMLRATTDTINASPPLYFVLGWIWTRLFGLTVLSLRLLSTLAAALAAVVMFAVLRRSFGVPAALIGVAGVFWTQPEILHQSVEARFHVLPLLELAAALWLMQAVVRRRKASRGLLWASAAVHASIVMTHYFGILYAPWIVLGGVASRMWRRRSPWPALIPPLVGWATLVPWWPALHKHIEMGRPTTWVPVPDSKAFLSFYKAQLPGLTPKVWVALAALAVASLVFGALMGKRRAVSLRRWCGSADAARLLAGVGFLLVPVVVYALSRREGGTSVWLARYMIPTSLGVSVVLAQLAGLAFRYRVRGSRAPALTRRSAALQCSVLAMLLSGPALALVEAPRGPMEMPPSDRALPSAPDGGIVVEHIHVFLYWNFYSERPRQYAFLVDPEVGRIEGGGGPLNEKNMDALGREFPEQFANVSRVQDYLASRDDFLIVLSDGVLARRIAADPAWDVQMIGPGLARAVRRPAPQ
jgi:hypothetical protein